MLYIGLIFCAEAPPSATCNFVNPGWFNFLIDQWLSTSAGIYYVEQFSRTVIDVPPKILALRLIFLQNGIYNDEDAVKNIVQTRRISDASSLPMYPSGFVFDLYEQYVNVRKYLGQQLGFISIGIICISWIFLLHPGMVAIMMAVIVVITVEIYGVLYFFNIKLNGVCVINIVFSLGMSVEFTAHISRLFMVIPGTRAERAQAAMAKMIFPLCFSATSTILGVLPLNFAKFPYFILYFFNQLVIILLIGLYNGVILLPIILSFIGPPAIGGGGGPVKEVSANVELPQLEEGEEEHN